MSRIPAIAGPMIERHQVAPILHPSVQPRCRGGKVGAQAEGENADHDRVEAFEIAGKRFGVDLGDIGAHALEPEADTVRAAADIADAGVGQGDVERHDVECQGADETRPADMEIGDIGDGMSRMAVDQNRQAPSTRCEACAGGQGQSAIGTADLDAGN